MSRGMHGQWQAPAAGASWRCAHTPDTPDTSS